MSLTTLAIFFIPEEWLPVILAGAGLAWIVGARRTARAMFIFAILSLILPPILAPFIQMIPMWALWLLVVYLALLIPFFLISIVQGLVSPALGRRAASEAAGHWAADTGRFMFTAPFRLIFIILRFVARSLGGRP